MGILIMYTEHDIQNIRLEFSRRLTALADARGYPKNNYGRNTQLAADIGVSPPFIYKLFHGQIASVYTLREIAVKLHTTTDYLLGLNDEMDSVEYKKKHTNQQS